MINFDRISISDFEEQEFDLGDIGLPGFTLNVEEDDVYISSEDYYIPINPALFTNIEEDNIQVLAFRDSDDEFTLELDEDQVWELVKIFRNTLFHGESINTDFS